MYKKRNRFKIISLIIGKFIENIMFTKALFAAAFIAADALAQ